MKINIEVFIMIWYSILFYFLQGVTGGHGEDVIVEMLVNARLSKDLKLVANKGRIGVCLYLLLLLEKR